MVRRVRSGMVSLALVVACAPHAQEQSREALLREIEALRREQAAMQERFDARLKALEAALAAKPVAASPIAVSLLAQTRFEAGTGLAAGFLTRRMEIKLGGKIGRDLDWVLMFDPAKSTRLATTRVGGVVTDVDVDQRSRMLQDAFVAFRPGGGWTIEVGQKKVPFSKEGLQPTDDLEQTERSMLNTILRFGDARELGLQVHKAMGDWTFTGAVLNGVGETMNARETDTGKIVGGRAVYRPSSVPGLHVGLAAMSGGLSDRRRERLGGELAYRRGPLTLTSELASGFDGDARSFSGYGSARWRVGSRWEVAGRFDRMNSELASLSDGNETQWTLGAIYHFDDKARVQASLVRRQFRSLPHRDAITVQVQAKF
ncbi:MAG: hypothetical protein H3C58_01685 [Fimbriimonadaceae bacterium]|nr:hypothetical protein [Fimbriimonadaceae bacterium]